LAVIAMMRGRRSAADVRSHDRARGLDAVHLGHLDVHQHHVVGVAKHRVQRVAAVADHVRP
jgi:hypothetical protein